MIKIKLQEELTSHVGGVVGSITAAKLAAAQGAMRSVALSAEAQAKRMASMRLSGTAQMYIDALKFSKQGDGVYMLILGAEASHLEEGYPSFDMLAAGLARGPKSKVSKEGYRYVTIPFEHKQAAATPGHPEHGSPVQIGQEQETTRGSLAADLKYAIQTANNALKMERRAVRTAGGAPVVGKAWTMTPTSGGYSFKDVLGNIGQSRDIGVSPLLSGLTAYQRIDRAGRVQKGYVTFRTASEKYQGQKWIHPGFDGIHVFRDLEQWVKTELDSMLREIFSE
jgi:hypothetical protein